MDSSPPALRAAGPGARGLVGTGTGTFPREHSKLLAIREFPSPCCVSLPGGFHTAQVLLCLLPYELHGRTAKCWLSLAGCSSKSVPLCGVNALLSVRVSEKRTREARS